VARPRRVATVLRGFTARLLLGVLAIHAVLLPLLFGGVLYLVERTYQDQFVDHVRSDAHLLAVLAGQVERRWLQGVMEELVLSGHVLFVRLVDASGRVVAAAGEQDGPFREDFFFGQHGDGVYHIELPLLGGEAGGRRLRLGYDEAPARAQIARAWRRGLGLAAAYVFLTVVLVAFWGRRMSRPLLRLRQASRSIARGRFDESLDVESSLAEIRSLAEDLDHMRRELVSQARHLEHLAMHDPLTGLPNRALFRDRLRQALQASRRRPAPFAVFIIDLDRFKEINDTLGHNTGDRLLQQVASRLAAQVRDADTVARLGGDEFALLLPSLGREHAPAVARKIVDALAVPCRVEGRVLEVGASVGVALHPEHGASASDLMRRADVAMYAAKRDGCGFALYDPDLDRHSLQQLTLTSELRRAIERGELVVHYQPQLDLARGRISGVEALVRWQHPEHGPIPPDDFIPAAEQTGLIAPLTEAVLAAAVRDCRAWREAGHPLRLAVNLSAYSLRGDGAFERLGAIIRAGGLPRGTLVLELTESALLGIPLRVMEKLAFFEHLGVPISIDDFGSGYSPLMYLKRLPVCELKIGKSFVMEMARDDSDAAIVRGVAGLAHTLGLTVVAEGVEDARTLEMVRALGCDTAQGYHVGRPMPAGELLSWLRDRAG